MALIGKKYEARINVTYLHEVIAVSAEDAARTARRIGLTFYGKAADVRLLSVKPVMTALAPQITPGAPSTAS